MSDDARALTFTFFGAVIGTIIMLLILVPGERRTGRCLATCGSERFLVYDTIGENKLRCVCDKHMYDIDLSTNLSKVVQ